ncbi:MAG: adenylyltransferase/cytidyltransferase family protein [Candidatus Magasanikbacteria bacterium]
MKTLMLFGTFDGLHMGHIHLLQSAKKKAERIIVVIARDERVKELKGHFPLHTQTERKKIIESIQYVERGVIGHKTDIYSAVKKYQPDYIGLGYDQKFFTDDLKIKLKELGLEKTQIIRFPAYRSNKCKSSIVRKRLEQEI